MTHGKIRALGDLPNKPLVEAIFELRWELSSRGPHVAIDSGWSVLPGLFYAAVRNEYPARVNLPASEIPDQLTPYIVRHQFRAAENGWPLIQLGPGIMTINSTSDYTVWDDFCPRLTKALRVLSEVYPVESGQLNPVQAELRFINAVPFELEHMNPVDFLKEQLHVTVTADSDLASGGEGNASPTSVNLNLMFHLNSPPGEGLLSFAVGKKEHQTSIIWHIAVRSHSNDLPRLDSFTSWADDAHAIIEQWFLSLSEGALLDNFQGKSSDRNIS